MQPGELSAPLPRPGEEVAEQVAPVVGEHGFGVELNPFGGQFAVAYRHDDAAPEGTLLEAVRQRGSATSEW